MDLDDARQVLREQHRAVLATRRSDGDPQLSPVVVGIDDDGAAIVSTRETALKTKNLRREPRAWLCVLPDGFFGRWIQVEGDVEIVELPDALEVCAPTTGRCPASTPTGTTTTRPCAASAGCCCACTSTGRART